MGFWDEEAFEDSGGGISTFEGTITDAYFSENDYGASLRITSMFDHGELYPDKPDGTYTQFYSLGQQATEWKVDGDGETVAHQDDPNKKARKDSDLGRLGEAFKALDGLREARPDFNPYAASSYKGLHLEWQRSSYEVKRYKKDEAGQRIPGPDGKDLLEPVTKYIMLPVALIGAESSNGAGELDVSTLGLDTPTLVALSTMAQATDASTFMVEVAKGYSSNKALMTAVTKDTEGTRQALADAII